MKKPSSWKIPMPPLSEFTKKEEWEDMPAGAADLGFNDSTLKWLNERSPYVRQKIENRRREYLGRAKKCAF